MNRHLISLAVLTAAISWNALEAQAMVITRSGSRPAQPGSSATFTGTVRVTPLFDANETTRTSSASVSFQAGARSAWHTHPRGQILIVTAGVGRVQQWGGAVEEIRSGDVVRTAPGVNARPQPHHSRRTRRRLPNDELPFHLEKALDNGISKDELIELITHLAFYSGWPTANTALPIARRVFQEKP